FALPIPVGLKLLDQFAGPRPGVSLDLLGIGLLDSAKQRSDESPIYMLAAFDAGRLPQRLQRIAATLQHAPPIRQVFQIPYHPGGDRKPPAIAEPREVLGL